MSDPSVERLREQLRSLGYLSHGIERWFALDPWRSRTFWTELVLLALKVVAACALPLTAPFVVALTIRNRPLPLSAIGVITVLFLLSVAVSLFVIVVLTALALKARVVTAIERPRLLNAISVSLAVVLTGAVVMWWLRFPEPPSVPEALVMLLLLIVALWATTVVLSAALLSFSIHETQRIPSVQRARLTAPISVVATLLVVASAIAAFRGHTSPVVAPLQVPTTPNKRQVVLIGVDGLTSDIFRARRSAAEKGMRTSSLLTIDAPSSAERWATLGTGTPGKIHGVRAIEGVRLAFSGHVLQTLPSGDFVNERIGPLLGLAKRVPIPPTVRRRDYVWEVFASRGVPASAVNWWVSTDEKQPAFASVSQERVFASAAGRHPRNASELATTIDSAAIEASLRTVTKENPRFATVYLPALDIVLNRLELGAGEQLAASVLILDRISQAVEDFRRKGYDVILVGMPGDRQKGDGIVAASFPLNVAQASPLDIAPTLCELMGFPATEEMPGTPLVSEGRETRIRSYGDRNAGSTSSKLDQEYYENLKSLGYIR